MTASQLVTMDNVTKPPLLSQGGAFCQERILSARVFMTVPHSTDLSRGRIRQNLV